MDGLLGLTDRFERAFADDHDVRLRSFRAGHLGVLRDSATLVADVVTRRVDGLRRVFHFLGDLATVGQESGSCRRFLGRFDDVILMSHETLPGYGNTACLLYSIFVLWSI